MTVKELMETLSGYDEDMEVTFSHPSHDYWRTTLITPVDNAEEGYAKYSEYHSQLAVATEEEVEEFEYLQDNPDEEAPKGKEVQRVLILS